jgi:hypothetical protein
VKNIRSKFTPGQFAGSFAAGDRIAASSSLVTDLRAGQVPDKKSDFYPWMTCVPAYMGPNDTGINQIAPAGTMVKFTRQDMQDPAFRNGITKRILVDQMRVASIGFTTITQGNSRPVQNIAYTLGAKVVTPRQTYLDNWVPLVYLNNHYGTFRKIVQLKGSYELPTPYFLSMKSPLRMRVRQRYQTTGVGTLTCWFSANGVGVDGFPIQILKQITIPEKTPFAPPYYYDVVFDDNRDRLLRDAWITSISFCFGTLDQADMINEDLVPHVVLSALELQFRPMDGPRWMREDDWIPLWMLQNQPGMLNDYTTVNGITDFSQVIHNFEAPLVLNPRDEIQVWLRINQTFNEAGDSEVIGFHGTLTPIWCAFYGRQEA